MLDYIEQLQLPTAVSLALVVIFAIIQAVGEFLEMKGKVVPEFVKIRKYFARKQKEREILHQLPDVLAGVDTKLRENEDAIKQVSTKLDEHSDIMLSMLIDNKRNTIINFASFVIDEKNPVTREQFNRVFKLYEEYEDTIKLHNLTNGEVDIAIKIIRESYADHLKASSFVEDVRGY